MSSDRRSGTSDRGLAILLALGAAVVVVHLLTGERYGFHRDELATLDDARHLAWGYVAYPPVNAVLWMAVLEIIWHVVNRVPIFRSGVGFGRSSFDWAHGARVGRQDRCPSDCRVRCDSLRARRGKSDAVCGVRLPGLGSLFVFFRSVVPIARSTVVARNRSLCRSRHADEI